MVGVGVVACARCWVLRDRIFSASVEEGRTSGPLLLDINGQGEGYRPYFENYTVDASILDSGIYVWITKI